MPSDSRIDIELPSKCLKCRAAWTVTDHIEAGAQFHSRQRVEKMLEALLIVETPNEQEARTVAGSPRRKKICCHRHRSDLWMSARHQRLGLLFEPARNGRQCRATWSRVECEPAHRPKCQLHHSETTSARAPPAAQSFASP